MSHSILPPSSAGIWGKPDGCTGWVLMAQTYPETETNEEALEGEASHEIAAELINYMSRGVFSTPADEFVDQEASNGVIYTDEMFEGAEVYAKNVADVMRDTGVFGGECFGTEVKVLASRIHELSYGTTDQFIFARHIGHLYVWDYKFGYEMVEVFECWQLINYVAGICEKFNIDGIEEQNITVHLRIVQPRAFHPEGIIREWVVKLSDLRGHINTLHHNAHVALSNDAVIRSGPHCKHCQARLNCPAALKAGMSLYEIAMRTLPIDLPPEALGLQYAIVKRAIKQLEYLQSAYDEQVKSVIRKGGLVPNFMVEMGYGRLEWTETVAKIIEIGNERGYSLQKETDVITPTQAKKLGVPHDVIEQYSKRPKAGLKVVPDNGTKAKRIFSNDY